MTDKQETPRQKPACIVIYEDFFPEEERNQTAWHVWKLAWREATKNAINLLMKETSI